MRTTTATLPILVKWLDRAMAFGRAHSARYLPRPHAILIVRVACAMRTTTATLPILVKWFDRAHSARYVLQHDFPRLPHFALL